jgi:hypothetical protein
MVVANRAVSVRVNMALGMVRCRDCTVGGLLGNWLQCDGVQQQGNAGAEREIPTVAECRGQ